MVIADVDQVTPVSQEQQSKDVKWPHGLQMFGVAKKDVTHIDSGWNNDLLA